MQLIGRLDPSLGPNSFSTGIAARGGKVILHNLSPYELILTFGNDQTRQATLFAWQPREFDFCGRQTDEIAYSVLMAPTNQIDAPSTILIGEAYAPGEPTPKSHPNYDRLSNVGNQSLPTASSPGIVNDGQPPNQRIIESTPNDQTTSAIDATNDGSMQWNILSAGQQMQVLQVIRGNTGTVKATITLGDANDPTLLVMHGQADNASTAGLATNAVSANTSKQVSVYDGGVTNINQITQYEGTLDPQTYLTPNVGDIWFEG